MSRQYSNPPLREAVCEFRYRADGHWDLASPGLIYSVLSNEFPRRLAERSPAALAAPVFGSPDLVPHEVQVEFRVGPQEPLKFWRESDEYGHIAVAPYSLSVHHFKPYPSWEGFSGIIDRSAKAYQEVLKPTKVQRIGLRYINDIDLDQTPASLEEFFDFYPFVGSNLPQNLSTFQCLVQCAFEDARDSLILRMTTVPKSKEQNAQVVLDLDYFLAQPDHFELTETAKWLEQAHSNLESVFEGCLKEPARKLFYEKG